MRKSTPPSPSAAMPASVPVSTLPPVASRRRPRRAPQIWLLGPGDDQLTLTELIAALGSPCIAEDVDPSDDEVRP